MIRIIYKCVFCGKIHIKEGKFISLPICVCGSEAFETLTENKYRELKLKRILKELKKPIEKISSIQFDCQKELDRKILELKIKRILKKKLK